MEALIPTFLDAQATHIAQWLLNYQLYAVVAALLILSAVIPAYRMSRQTAIGVAQDYLYGVSNVLFALPLIAVAIVLIQLGAERWAPWMNLHLYTQLPAAAQVLLAIVLTDLTQFLAHRLLHCVRPFWHFHTIHHSQQQLNPLTTRRNHVGEKLIELFSVGWIPLVVMGSPTEVWVAVYLVDSVWVYFIHSNLRISWGPFKYVLVSPLYHRLHHSVEPRHVDKNFANRFVIWDLLSGTADFDYSQVYATGAPLAPIALETSLRPLALLKVFVQQFLYPFRMIARDWRERG
jgi:sterol desaturase/sphingolipid hydroxylase (fatty acid hydroxylase superfamily)